MKFDIKNFNFKEYVKKRGVATYINLVVLILTIASLIVYCTYAGSAEGLTMPWVIVMLVLTMVGEVSLFVFDNDYVPIAMPCFIMVALGCFLVSPQTTIGSVVDYFQDIVMFGNPDNFGIIVAVVVLLLITSIASIVSCFFERVKSVKK